MGKNVRICKRHRVAPGRRCFRAPRRSASVAANRARSAQGPIGMRRWFRERSHGGQTRCQRRFLRSRSWPVRGRTAAAQDLLKVAVPQRGVWDAGVPELGMRAGIFQKHGLNLEILYTQAGPESIQALIAGSVDLATAAGVSAAFGTFAKGAPIRIVSNEIAGSPDLYWYVTANSPVRKVEDFNDKTVAYSLTGLVEPCRAPGADRAIQSSGQAHLDRQYSLDTHADAQRPGRSRLRRGAVRARPGRGRADPRSSSPATTWRA